MADERRQFDRVTERIKNFCGLLISVLTIVSAAVATVWALYGVPEINKCIEARVSPVETRVQAQFSTIERSTDYTEARLRAMMTPAQAKKADEIFVQMRRSRGQP